MNAVDLFEEMKSNVPKMVSKATEAIISTFLPTQNALENAFFKSIPQIIETVTSSALTSVAYGGQNNNSIVMQKENVSSNVRNSEESNETVATSTLPRVEYDGQNHNSIMTQTENVPSNKQNSEEINETEASSAFPRVEYDGRNHNSILTQTENVPSNVKNTEEISETVEAATLTRVENFGENNNSVVTKKESIEHMEEIIEITINQTIERSIQVKSDIELLSSPEARNDHRSEENVIVTFMIMRMHEFYCFLFHFI